MELHLINGFLGSGKTTAIIGAAKTLIEQGKTVGIVTNDKGQFQVDTAFYQAGHIPTRQVTGGCFRCSFAEFEQKISQLRAAFSPDVLFAESVGSCVDLVNTIFSPLLQKSHLGVEQVTYSMFADIRLFRYWLYGELLPFSDSIAYLYEQQIEEGQLLVLNKADLLAAEHSRKILGDAQARFPQKTIILQNALDSGSLQPWLAALHRQSAGDARPDFRVNYQQYKSGEQEMAWFDQTIMLETDDDRSIRPAVIEIIQLLLTGVQQANGMVGHLKFLVSAAQWTKKLSFTTADFLEQDFPSAWAAQIPDSVSSCALILNARVKMPAQDFADIVHDALNQVELQPHFRIRREAASAYNPEMSLMRPESLLALERSAAG